MIQNAADRLITRSNRTEHTTPVLKSLHWLPVHFRVDFKFLMITFKAHRGLVPHYTSDLLIPYEPVYHLRYAGLGHCWPFLGQNLKLKWQELFCSGPLSCGMTCRWRSGKQTLSSFKSLTNSLFQTYFLLIVQHICFCSLLYFIVSF